MSKKHCFLSIGYRGIPATWSGWTLLHFLSRTPLPVLYGHCMGLRKLGSELQQQAQSLHGFRGDWCAGPIKSSGRTGHEPRKGKAVVMSAAQGTSRRAPRLA